MHGIIVSKRAVGSSMHVTMDSTCTSLPWHRSSSDSARHRTEPSLTGGHAFVIILHIVHVFLLVHAHMQYLKITKNE